MKKWDEIEAKLLQDPNVRREYEKLEPEYQLARALVKARLQKKLTQAELAKRAGISQVLVARLESGTSNPTLHTITKVAQALGKEVRLVGTR